MHFSHMQFMLWYTQIHRSKLEASKLIGPSRQAWSPWSGSRFGSEDRPAVAENPAN